MTTTLPPTERKTPYIIAWAFGSLFYFLEYAVRSAPAVMIPELSDLFGVTAVGVSTIAGMYYYTYSTTSLVAGIWLDHRGARTPITTGIAILGVGCLLFSLSGVTAANTGRLLQGAGSAFAFTGCVYLAAHGFSGRVLATVIGFTQCLGMLGGSAGQFVVGPMIHNGVSVSTFWIACSIISLLIAVGFFIVTPRERSLMKVAEKKHVSLWHPYKIVFSNVQSYLCGIVSGLLFAPTTIFVMTWGVAFFEHDRSLSYHAATITSSMVPLGWVFGCPLLGWLADKFGNRKPVLIGGEVMMLVILLQLVFLPGLAPGYITMFLFGVASGAAMIPYSMIKETNPDEVKGSATGAINFITFGVTALIGPVFARLFGGSLTNTANLEQHFRQAGLFWVTTTIIAIVVSLLLRETGPRVHLVKT